MTSLVEHHSPWSSSSWLPERRRFFYWWKKPLFAIWTLAVYTINHIKWAGEESGALPGCIYFRLSRFIFPVFPQCRPLEEGLGALACLIRRSVIWCYRWCCYLGELLQVSGGNQTHAIPHAPIKAPAQRGALFSSSGLQAGKSQRFLVHTLPWSRNISQLLSHLHSFDKMTLWVT